MNFSYNACEILRKSVRKSLNEELQIASLKVLLSLLPIQSKFGDKSKFPITEFSVSTSAFKK